MKILITLIVAILLVAFQHLMLDQTEELALRQAPIYQEPPDSMFGGRPASASNSDDLYTQIQAENAKKIFYLSKFSHYSQYKKQYVEPIKEKLDLVVNIAFGVLYVLLSGYLLVLIRLKAIELLPNVKAVGVAVANLPSKVNKLPAIKSRQLNTAVKEFESAKTLYENGLMSEGDFLKKKAELRHRMDVLST